MDLSYKQKTTKAAAYIIITALAALIQNTQGLTIEIGGARCFLLIPVCVILAMGEDERFGALIALFGGLLWDLTSAVHLGFNAIFLCIMCFFGASLVTYIFRNIFLTNFIYSVMAIMLYCLLYWLFFIIFPNIKGAELSLFSFYLPSGIYTIAATPIIYFSLKPLKKALNKPIKYLTDN